MKRREHPAECPTCNGFGTTKETATEMKAVNGKLRTMARGSGCPKCFGVGRIEVSRASCN